MTINGTSHIRNPAVKPNEIRAKLLLRGVRLTDIAADLGVERGTVCTVVHGRGKSRRIARRISDLTGIPISHLWPGLYPDPKPALRRAA